MANYNTPSNGFKKGHPNYLKAHSNKAKKKIGEGLKKVYKSGERTPYWLGKKRTEKTRTKMSEARYGHKHSEETKQKIGESHLREKCYRWNPDREAVRRNQRNDPEYKQWVRGAKKRDGNICQLQTTDCLGYNIVHHIKGWKQYPKLRYLLTNGITLCQRHHPRTRADEERLKPILQKLVKIPSV